MQWRATYGLIKFTTDWMVQGLNPGGNKIFCTHPDRAWGPPSLPYIKYQVFFPQVKHPGHGINHPPPSSTEVKESVQLQLYSPLGLHDLFYCDCTFYFTRKIHREIRYMLSLLLFMTWKLQGIEFCCTVCTTWMSINNVRQYLLA
jgi:hypothetical protein